MVLAIDDDVDDKREKSKAKTEYVLTIFSAIAQPIHQLVSKILE